MRVSIYVEGGGDHNQAVTARCKRGFVEYFRNVAPDKPQPKVVVCGSRDEAFKRYLIAVEKSGAGELCGLLVDSKAAVPLATPTIAFLQIRDRWNFQNVADPQVFLMVQAMEAWLLADRQALLNYYGQGFRISALRGDERNVEAIPKADLEQCLVAASQDTTKGSYHKTRHAFDILAKISPAKVAASSRHAVALHEFSHST